MKTVNWNRTQVIADVREDIWRYLTQAAKSEEDVVLDAAALLQMRRSDVRRLAQLQFVLSEDVRDLLDQLPRLARRLNTTTLEELETSAERVRGAIRWSETISTRARDGSSFTLVTAPARRAFNTPENEVLVFALRAIADFGRRTGWHRSTSADVGDEVRRRVAAATRWQSLRALADVPRGVPSERTVARARSGRRRRDYAHALSVRDLHRRFIAQLDLEGIREAVEQHALVVARDSVLLELLCGFTIVRTLSALGWKAGRPSLLRPPLIHHAIKGHSELRLFYQHAPARLSGSSVYRDVQRAHRFGAVGGLIPDFVLTVDDGDTRRQILVEVKGVERKVEESARAAAFDLLAYRRTFGGALDGQVGPYGIGVAWGANLVSSETEEIILCSPDTLGAAIAHALS